MSSSTSCAPAVRTWLSFAPYWANFILYTLRLFSRHLPRAKSVAPPLSKSTKKTEITFNRSYSHTSQRILSDRVSITVTTVRPTLLASRRNWMFNRSVCVRRVTHKAVYRDLHGRHDEPMKNKLLSSFMFLALMAAKSCIRGRRSWYCLYASWRSIEMMSKLPSLVYYFTLLKKYTPDRKCRPWQSAARGGPPPPPPPPRYATAYSIAWR
jgi:hypothetical protein